MNMITSHQVLSQGLFAADNNEMTRFEQWNENVSNVLGWAYGHSLGWVLIFALMGGGIYFTVVTKAMQITMFGHMFTTIFGSRRDARDGISSFQAFAIGLADRVGTGNIAGVALAIVGGGPGAIFWMWVVALIGMATGFIESTLGQIFKIKNVDGTYRGGPAFYIERGLGSRLWGAIFAVLLIFAYGVAFQMIQANTMAQVLGESFGIKSWVSAVILLLLTVPFFLGGIRPVARTAEFIAPVMAVAYLVLTIIVIAVYYQQVPVIFGWIFAYAFGVKTAAAGTIGGILVALEQGVKRGLFSNEAGMGSVPNAAATATVTHPVKQGLVQSMGVFVDTIVVCTCTAFIILLSGIYNPTIDPKNIPDSDNGAALTTSSIATIGDWAQPMLVIIILVFGYSTILGNYAYAEGNVKYLLGVKNKGIGLAILVGGAVFLGAILSLKAVWAVADWATGLMAVVNLVAITILGKWALGALADYKEQLKTKAPEDIYFCSTDNPYLPGKLDTEVWNLATVQADVRADAQAQNRPHDNAPLLERLIDSE
ncbi:MAG: alanine/glycine:cation symporter family protein [Actinomycetaceae bacterium]|nr:alanine/glycine:cation symporter family protein [Actinomycetaceae bacterium]